ncbi:cytoskeletal protein Sojo [Papilio machaon]|uniref:cytoskeletal protein Sojo n=1 Tax=Papilio machaon TaxID=76193 RepID=UPI001E665CF6|nr:cytoskeletal protein Sojo [Papilio machaon]
MSFNVDDPLAGILSDGSDDSFFDDDILGKKKPAKKNITAVDKKSALFDLDDSTEPNIEPKKIEASEALNKVPMKTKFSEKNKLDNQQLKPSASFKLSANADSKRNDLSLSKDLNEVTDIKKSPYKSKIGTSNEKIDILDDILGSKKSNVEQTDKRKGSQSILDDILGKPSKDSTQVIKSATVKNQQYNIVSKNDSKDTLSSKKQSKQPLPVPTNENVEQKKAKSSEDWLGIFQEENEETEKDNSDMPSWLGGSSVKKTTLEKRSKTETQKAVVKEPDLPKLAPTNQSNELTDQKESTDLGSIKISDNIEKTRILPNVEVQIEEDVAMQGAAVFLQQQEAQLMVALQLKAQDEKLAEMQLKQKEAQRVHREAAAAQHAQLDAMLQKQANHRLQMQAIINAHQDRIAQRIKALLDSNETGKDGDMNVDGNDNASKDNSESPRNKEKKQLLQLIQSLQENHDKEIDLMETSYRKQLAFLELSLSQTEERMKEESDKVLNYYMEKINWLEEHHGLYKKWTEENTASLIERHNVEKEMLRQQHIENVKVLQEHHTALMENIKNAVKQEQVLMRDSAGFSSDIQELLANVRENKLKCEQLVDKVSTLNDKTQTEVERSLQVRETQINDMIQQLKKEREYFEKEKSETKDTIHTLEVRIKQMTTMIEEDTAVLRQKKMEFEFEKATFSKQTEFAKNVLKKQDEEVKMLKEEIQKEYKEKISLIEEEKSKLMKDSSLVAKEKATVQSLRMELEKTKAELQAQLEEMSEERSKLGREKQDLHMEEQRIIAKGKDLDLLTKAALEKQSQAEKKYSEAENQQRRYEERMHKLQEHIVSLNTREKQIAKEKIALSRERINLHNDWKQMEGKQQCSLCRSIPRTPQYNFDAAFSRSYDAPASRDYGEANMSNAVSAIEQEMAHLMGRSFALKHDTAIEQRMSTVRDNFDSVHTDTVPSEPGAFKDYMDPKFMMLRLDVQKVIHNLGAKEGTTNN